MKVILLCGKGGSGKSTVASLVKEYYTYQKKESVITEFSKYLKLYANEILGWDYNPETKPRKFLQDLGSRVRHSLFNEDFLIDRMLDDLAVYEEYKDVVIIADIRLPREIDRIKEECKDTISVYVENQFSKSTLSVEEQTHETEVSLEQYNNFDYTVINDDKDKLKDYVFKMLDEVENNGK